MKKILVIIGILATSSLANAAKVGPAGCGLGHLVFGKDTQVLAATTNGSSGSQTFGITSGTSNCATASTEARLNSFIEGNRYAFATDMARGHGDTLAALGSVLGCMNQTEVNNVLKSNFETIFPSQDAKVEEISNRVLNVLRSKPEVSNQCSLMS